MEGEVDGNFWVRCNVWVYSYPGFLGRSREVQCCAVSF